MKLVQYYPQNSKVLEWTLTNSLQTLAITAEINEAPT